MGKVYKVSGLWAGIEIITNLLQFYQTC